MRASTRRDGAHTINSKLRKVRAARYAEPSPLPSPLPFDLAPFVSIAQVSEAKVIATENGGCFIAKASIVAKDLIKDIRRVERLGSKCE